MLKACVTVESSNMGSCGYDSEETKPKHVTVSLFGESGQIQQQQPFSNQKQSQSQSSENRNTIIICNKERCDVNQ
ncbi:MAG: hypothetical protein ACRD8W_24875 [Nitrososphaeraceae archaeon]